MPKIVVTAAVKDVEAWLKFKPEMIAQMSAVASDGTSYVAMDGRVASTWDVPDLEAFQAAQTAVSPEMAEAMERYGMIPPVTVYVEK
jgi:redox-regulated HSP33 family molecular chaperone